MIYRGPSTYSDKCFGALAKSREVDGISTLMPGVNGMREHIIDITQLLLSISLWPVMVNCDVHPGSGTLEVVARVHGSRGIVSNTKSLSVNPASILTDHCKDFLRADSAYEVRCRRHVRDTSHVQAEDRGDQDPGEVGWGCGIGVGLYEKVDRALGSWQLYLS